MSNPLIEQRERVDETANKRRGASKPENRVLKTSNNILIVSVVVALICLSFFLITNSRLRREKAELVSRLSGQLAGAPSAEVGDIVPQFQARSIDTTQSSITYEGKSKYLLYVFSPTCDVCRSEFPTWNEIASTATSHGYKVIGLATYSDAALQGTPSHNFEVAAFPSKATQRAYRIVAVPTVMVVSGNGRIEWVQTGKLPADKITELLSTIKH
jgi:peroxiredoxin